MIILSEKLDFNFHKLIIKHNLEFLCGYIGVPCEHPLFKIAYHQCLEGCKGEENKYITIKDNNNLSWYCDHKTPEDLFKCHGGLTYSGNDLEGGYPELWYFGFDCAHSEDYIPKMPRLINGIYRDKEYVSEQLDNLLHQIKSYILIKEIN